MRFVITSVLAAAAIVAAVPSPAATLPVLELAAPEFQKSPSVDISLRSAQVNPTILFYPGRDCLTGGSRLSIVDRLFNTCLLSTPPTYGSVKIDNPSGTWLPYIIQVNGVGSTCPAGLVALPSTNQCYNINPSGANGWYISNTGGGTF